MKTTIRLLVFCALAALPLNASAQPAPALAKTPAAAPVTPAPKTPPAPDPAPSDKAEDPRKRKKLPGVKDEPDYTAAAESVRALLASLLPEDDDGNMPARNARHHLALALPHLDALASA